MSPKLYAIEILLQLSFVPYRWGGSNPMTGFDCSGLVIEVLKSVGLLEPRSDYTAQGLADLLPETDKVEAGCVVFYDWDNDGKADHCDMVSAVLENGAIITVGASGGGPTTKDLAMAVRQNAYVKHRVMRTPYMKVCNPFIALEA